MAKEGTKIVGALFIFTGVICGPFMLVGLFFSGLVASGAESATTKICVGLEFESDCMNKCGCGWCEHTAENTTKGYCYPIGGNHCTGKFNDKLPENCEERYNNAIIAVIAFGSAAACCLVTVCCGILIECCVFIYAGKVTVYGNTQDIDSEADL